MISNPSAGCHVLRTPDRHREGSFPGKAPTEDAQILGGELELSDASVTQHLSTLGMFDTTLEFDWRASIFGDHLDVLLSLDGTAYDKLATFFLNDANFKHVTLSLPQADNQADVYFRWFSTTASHIDNVTVIATPVPAALPLFATGLGVMGLFAWWRRRTYSPSKS